MRNYKKRTLALILASTITIAGSFGAENYKNSLMKLDFKSVNNSVVATFHTKTQYESKINLVKTASDTYIATLPDTNSEISSPSMGRHIKSVDIKTMPKTTNSSGYTKVVIKTDSNIPMEAVTAIYLPPKPVQSIPDKKQETNKVEPPEILPQETTETVIQNNIPENKPVSKTQPNGTSSARVNNTNIPQTSLVKEKENSSVTPVTSSKKASKKSSSEFNIAQAFPYIFGGLIVFLLVMVIYVQSKKKMAEVVGENMDFDFDDSEEKKIDKKSSPKKKKQVKEKKYTAPITQNLNKVNMITGNIQKNEPEENIEPEEDNTPPMMVDLDELYQEKTNKVKAEDNQKTEITDEELDDLDDFLNDFSFEEEIEEQGKQEINEESLYNEELFNQIMNDKNIHFTKSDKTKIQHLLKSEITEETLEKVLNKVSIPIKPQRPSKQNILENLLTTYSIERNITFTESDVEILKKLISVEIDPSFVTDLRTNSKRTEIVSKEILSSNNEYKKPSEPKVLHVKDVLPDMAAEVKKQGNAQIVFEVKPDVVYFDDSYDVSTLHISETLPDFNNAKDDNKFKPSYKEDLVASGYEFETLNIKDKMPELLNIDNYKEPVINKSTAEDEKTDTEVLLNNIQNVTFKPFYDGTEDRVFFETEEIISEQIKQPQISQTNVNNKVSNRANSDAKKLLELIEQQQIKRQQKSEEQSDFKKELGAVTQKEEKAVTKPQPETKQLFGKCIMNNEEYKIISSCEISSNKGLYLGQKENSYMVIGYIDDNMFELKKYEGLNVTSMQARFSEKLGDDVSQYIVRLGRNKFIFNINGNSMEYVMDLC